MKKLHWWLLAAVISIGLHTASTWYVGSGLVEGPRPVTHKTAIEIASPPVREEKQPERLQFREPPDIKPPENLLTNRSTVATPNVPAPALRAARGGAPIAPGVGPAIAGPETRQLGTGLGDGADQFAHYVEELRETGLDVVFLIDATGSMDWALIAVKERVRDMMEWVRELVPIARFGVVAYRDVDDPEFVTRIQPLTFSTIKLERFLGPLHGVGGGSLRESVFVGMQTAVRDSGWRSSGKRLIILIGDAPPHRDELNALLQLVSSFHKGGGEITVLDISDDANPALLEARLKRKVPRAMYRGIPSYDFNLIAQAGGGDAVTLDGDIRLIRRLVTLIFGDAYSEDLAIALDAVESI